MDSLKAILSMPFEIIAADNFAFFKSSIVIALKKGLELGIQNLSLSKASLAANKETNKTERTIEH